MKKLTQNQLINIVSQVTEQNIKIKTRGRDRVNARSIYFKICRDVYKMNITAIANSLGMHHATVLHSLNHYKYWAKTNHNLILFYNEVLEVVTTGISVSGTKKELKQALKESEKKIVELRQEILHIEEKQNRQLHRALKNRSKKYSTKILELIIKQKNAFPDDKSICKEILAERFA
tara:strand:- start:2063 stop:2590 length:528 start_codon:yes stop_codon:yes gene_type:complete